MQFYRIVYVSTAIMAIFIQFQSSISANQKKLPDTKPSYFAAGNYRCWVYSPDHPLVFFFLGWNHVIFQASQSQQSNLSKNI